MTNVTCPHTDDLAVDRFAAAMKAKLAQKRAQGFDGWEECPSHELAQRLIRHALKGDPVDVANFCMFLAEADLTKAERRQALRDAFECVFRNDIEFKFPAS